MKTMFRRRATGVALAALVLALLTGCDASPANGADTPRTTASVVAADAPVITLYKNPTCQCCEEWAEYMRENGFGVEVEEGVSPGEVKAKYGIPIGLASCHTAVVGDYVLEGHVPADVVAQLLRERPQIAGLDVPGMPPGVPGMPDPGPNRDSYQIIAFDKSGATQVYAER